jgi:uncharacterized secreted protein with C-terminal beta-propeller domain
LTDFFRAGSEYSDYPYSGPDATAGDKLALNERGDFSNTNVQVAGVDESDTVKTDGEFIYTASAGTVTVVRASPPGEMEVVAQLNIANLSDERNVSVYVTGLFLKGDVLAVIFTEYSYMTRLDLTASAYAHESRTMLMVLDVADPQSATVRFSVGVSGHGVAERMLESYVYVIAQSYARVSANGEVEIPTIWAEGDTSLIAAQDIYYDPETRDANSFINILSVDLETSESRAESIVAGYASTVYMSHGAFYLTFQKWTSSGFILGSARTASFDSASTSIYKMRVDGLSLELMARGDVEGFLLNQFSMDESNGFLRVATTTEWSNMSNSVYVLDSTLNTVGDLLSVAPGERIYSARFVDDRLYLVTFRQVDPLFVIDLSIPSDPRILGELTMPGFSSYLQPVDENHVLGIGSENSAVKVSMYDVLNPAKPIENSKFVVPTYSYSDAQNEHKAVLFDLQKNLLVIPVSTYSWDSNGQQVYPSGAYVFEVSIERGITLKGVVQHETEYRSPSDYGYYDGIYRSLYIGDYLYTFSPGVVKASSLADLSTAGYVTYSLPSPHYGPVMYGL